MSEVTRDELNGLGQKVNTVQVDLAGNQAKTDRNEKEVDKLIVACNKNTESIGKLDSKIENMLVRLVAVVGAVVGGILGVSKLLERVF